MAILSGINDGDILLRGAAQGITPGTAVKVGSAGPPPVATGGRAAVDVHLGCRHQAPVITIVMMLILVVFGVVAQPARHRRISRRAAAHRRDLDSLPGASPDTVEREVVDQIEEVVSGISGVDQLNSSATDSFASIVVQFVFEKDLQQASQEIRDEISGIRNDLPPEMEEPVLTRLDPSELPIVSLTLSSPTLSGPELTRIADPDITRRLRGIQGIGEVTVVGGIEREMAVDLRPRDLQASGISVGQVVAALGAQNLAAPVGRLNREFDERTIRLRGRLEGPTDFAQLIVSQSNGRIVRLGDVATVHDGAEEPRSAAFYNDEAAVGIDIVKSKGFSTTAVADDVRREVAEIQHSLPSGISLRIVRDAGTRVEASVGNVEEALVEGAVLTVLVVFLFLNSWRSTVITGLALPVSVLASFIAVWAFGFTLNTMSLLGLSLAIGILIDDAIVVRENIVRHVDMGKDHYQASFEGTDEIGLAVAATTFSIVVVFVPIAFMGGIAQQWFAPFALTIACSVLVSLFVSFSLDPMLSAYWPDPHHEMAERSWLSRMLGRFNDWFDRQADRYKSVIGWALDHRWSMVALAVVTFVGALAMPALGILGGGFFPVTDDSEFIVALETPPGSNLQYTRIKAQEIAARARVKPEVMYTYTTIGGTNEAVDAGNVFVKLKPKAERARSQQMIEAEVRGELATLAGVTGSISTGFAGGVKQIQVELQGPDIVELQRLAEEAAATMRDGARCGGRRTVNQGSEAGARHPGRAGLGRFAGRHRRCHRAGAADGVCRYRRRRLDRSVGRDPRRHGAAGARSRGRWCRTSSRCR